MATAIPALVVTRSGGALPDGVSANDVYVEDNDGNVVVEVYNPTGAPVTLTEVTAATVAGDLPLASPTVEVAAGARVWIGPLPPVVFNDDQAQAHITDPSGQLVFRALRF